MYTPCYANDSECRTRERVVTCVDNDCYRLDEQEPTLAPFVYPNLKQGRLELLTDWGQDQDGLTRLTVGAALMSNLRCSLESRFTYWTEILEAGKTDGLWIGDLNVHYQLLAYPALQSSIGIGPRILTDGKGKSAGVNTTWLTELYPLRPFVVRLEGDAGNLGSALFLEGQASAGLVWKHFEAHAGLDHMQIGSVAFDSWFAGLRVHL